MLVCLARIVGAHGIKGLAKVRSFSRSALDLFQYQPLVDSSGRSYQLHLSRLLPNGVLLCQIDGCTTRNEAEALKGTDLYVDRSRMPELEDNTYYYADLEGLKITDKQGQILGRVKAVNDHGAGVYMDVVLENGSPATLPFFAECEVDLNQKQLVIDAAWLIDNSGKGSERDELDHML